MCGIVGFKTNCKISRQKIELTLQRMTSFIQHRGPDDFGYFYNEEKSGLIMSMGFRRLSIIDLSIDGHQPMCYQNLTITFNGEIYNHKEIKKELVTLGYTFNSETDTEVIIKGYHRFGIEIFKKLNGMFAIAIYNSENEELILTRDRLGIKPLNYYHGENGFCYSSELKAITQNEYTNLTLNKKVISQYLVHGYINHPNTIYNEVSKVIPGEIVFYTNGEIKKTTFWTIPDQENLITSENEAVSKLDKLLNSSVEMRMMADVPLGCFLSGGYDSSLVSAVMQHQSNSKIDTFSIGFNEKLYDESKYADLVSKHIKSNHHTFKVDIDHAKEIINIIYKTIDEPFADSSLIPTFLLSKLTKSKVTVALSGDGGDELFHGYRSYTSSVNLKRYQNYSKLLQPLQKGLNLSKLLYSIKPRYAKYPLLNNNTNIINNNYINAEHTIASLVKDIPFILDSRFFEINNNNRIADEHSRLDIKTYLPNDILMKVDKASMLNSLEARTPLLDHRIVEFSQLIDPSLKIRNGDTKYILKQLTHRYIPKEIMERPKKGFSIPLLQWLRTDLNYLITDNLNQKFIEEQNIFNSLKIQKLVSTFNTDKKSVDTNIIWNLVVFQLWWKENNRYISR